MQSIRFKKIINNKYILLFSFVFFITLSIIIREKVFASTVIHVTWNGQNTTNCRVPVASNLPGWSGAQASPSGSVDIPRTNFNLAGANSYTFTLQCDDLNYGTNIQYSKTILITNNVSLSFTSGGVANPYLTLSYAADSYFVDSYDKTVIRWNFSDPNGTCTASGGGWSGVKAATGVYTTSRNFDNYAVTRNYKLACTVGGTILSRDFDIWFDIYDPNPR